MDEITANDFIVVTKFIFDADSLSSDCDSNVNVRARAINAVYKVVKTNGYGLAWAQDIADKDANFQIFDCAAQALGVRKATPHDIAEYRMYLKSLDNHKIP